MRDVQVRYAERNGNYLAYSVFGSGNTDLAVHQTRAPIDLIWEQPQFAAFMEALGRLARVIVWDTRGSGASDPPGELASGVEQTADEFATVMDAAGCEHADVFDMTGGSTTIFAATFPERVRSIIMASLRATYPELAGLTREERKKLAVKLKSARFLQAANPRWAHDPDLQRWWERAGRLINSPELAARQLEIAGITDYRPFLPTIRQPVLVLHRRDSQIWDLASTRAATAMIPGARLVELPGSEDDLFLGDTGPVLTEIERFLAEPHAEASLDRQLATVLFTDFVASTAQLAERGDTAWRGLLDTYDRAMESIVTAHRGKVIKQTGDGTLAIFDGPARAVRCADTMQTEAAELGIALRAGLHTGEVEFRADDLAGLAVHIASRVADLADDGEVLVSRTVVDLTAGSGLRFEPRGEQQLKGVPGSWAVFAAQIPH